MSVCSLFTLSRYQALQMVTSGGQRQHMLCVIQRIVAGFVSHVDNKIRVFVFRLLHVLGEYRTFS